MDRLNWNQLPNVITSLRLLLLVPLAFYLTVQDYRLSLLIFFVAGVSDALDGFLAKRYNWVSRFGSILDPIADKALLVLTMALLTVNQKISLILFVLVALRDIYIVLGAYIFYKKIGPFNMQPSLISKLNTFVQILLVVAILVSLGYRGLPELAIQVFTYSVYFTVIASAINYTLVWGRKFKLELQKQNHQSSQSDSNQ
ncbi:MAG: CDP-alcohol phosphatidyltransferase family protein [Kangiellaceae bacterium]